MWVQWFNILQHWAVWFSAIFRILPRNVLQVLSAPWHPHQDRLIQYVCYLFSLMSSVAVISCRTSSTWPPMARFYAASSLNLLNLHNESQPSNLILFLQILVICNMHTCKLYFYLFLYFSICSCSTFTARKIKNTLSSSIYISLLNRIQIVHRIILNK